jgi:hypothetical protein
VQVAGLRSECVGLSRGIRSPVRVPAGRRNEEGGRRARAVSGASGREREPWLRLLLEDNMKPDR